MKCTTVCCHSSLLSLPLIRDEAHTYINLSWPSDGDDRDTQRYQVWDSARDVWMDILFEEARPSRLVIDDGSLVEVLRGLGPTIFELSQIALFANWLDKHVSDHVPLSRGRT